MFRRLFLVFLLLITASFSFANDDAWNCQQDQNSQQWVCLGDTASGGVKQNLPSESAEPPTAVVESVAATVITQPVPVVEAKPRPVVKPSIPVAPVTAPVVKVPPAEPAAPAPVAACETGTCQAPAAAEESSVNLNLLGASFQPDQEAIFRTLSARFKTDPWANCLAEPGTQKRMLPQENARQSSPLDLKSDYSEIFDNEIGSYLGDVELRRDDQRASAHSANYDSVSETLELHGDVYYSENELAVHSDTATIKFASDQAVLRDTLFIAPEAPLRGFAKTIYRDNKFLSRYQNVSYTGCRPGNQDWAVHAAELKVNKESGKGSAKNAWVEFKGVPIFYSPYLSFPVDNRRQSGFLAPSFGTTGISGFNTTIPYYWNIAPNYDATFHPHYFEKRGVLLAGNFRYLSEMSKGNVNLEYLPEDEILKESRYSGSFKNTSQFSQNLYSNLDLNYVSDDNYFNELGNALISPSNSFVKSAGDLNYVREGMALSTRFETYQAIDATLTGVGLPYAKLPQVNLNFNHSFEGMPVEALLETESVNFQHVSLVDGQRVNIKPSLSFPLQTASAYLTPKVAVQHSDYFLNHQAAGGSDQLTRTLPILSADTGVRFERELSIGDSNKLHTIEPRLFYLYIPKAEQNNIPVFDSSLYDFWFASLFRENRFSGSDRIQDANQVSAAITSRLIDPNTGLETLKLNIGQIFYFQNRDVTIPLLINGVVSESPVETSQYSPLVAELGSQLNKHFSIDSGVQWDPETNDFVRGKAELHFVGQPGEILNLGYLYRKNPLIPDHSNDITQTDITMHWPVYQQWSIVGRWQYSWLYNNTQDSFFGVEKENCCWRFRVIGRHYLNSLNRTTSADISNLNVDGSPQTGVFFQVEFKGLTGVGEKLDQFFEKSIYGYRRP